MRLPETVKCVAIFLAGAWLVPALAAAEPPLSWPDATGVTPTDRACKIVFQVLDASDKPIHTGYAIAVDKNVDPDHQPSYEVDQDAAGKYSFKGGGIADLSGQVKDGKVEIMGAGKAFTVEVALPGQMNRAAIIRRQCTSDVATLVFVPPSQANGNLFGEWRWVAP